MEIILCSYNRRNLLFLNISFDNDALSDHYERGRSVLFGNDLINTELRKQRVSKLEYLKIIQDILKMQKNVCLCRHFQHLNKSSALGRFRKHRSKFRGNEEMAEEDGDAWREDSMEGKKSYLDVWLVDFFSPSLVTDISDTTSLFILQLACIVNMVPRWKRLKLRVFMIKPITEEERAISPEIDNKNDSNRNENGKADEEHNEIEDGNNEGSHNLGSVSGMK